MENEFWISVELLSLGGNVTLMVIPRKRHFEILSEDQEIGRLQKDRDENWADLDGTLPPYASSIIGSGIDLYYLEANNLFKKAG